MTKAKKIRCALLFIICFLLLVKWIDTTIERKVLSIDDYIGRQLSHDIRLDGETVVLDTPLSRSAFVGKNQIESFSSELLESSKAYQYIQALNDPNIKIEQTYMITDSSPKKGVGYDSAAGWKSTYRIEVYIIIDADYWNTSAFDKATLLRTVYEDEYTAAKQFDSSRLWRLFFLVIVMIISGGLLLDEYVLEPRRIEKKKIAKAKEAEELRAAAEERQRKRLEEIRAAEGSDKV